jgi:hypothetical protein
LPLAVEIATNLGKGFNQMARIITCTSCSHRFLSYGSNCPVCGWRHRRKRRNWTALCAIGVSLAAVAATYLFMREIDRADDVAPHSPGPASARTKKQKSSDTPRQPLQGAVAQRSSVPRQ